MVRAARHAGDGLFTRSAAPALACCVIPHLDVSARHINCSAAAVALAWTIRNGNVIAIPESGSAEHVKENAVALSLILTPDELNTLDAAYPPSNR